MKPRLFFLAVLSGGLAGCTTSGTLAPSRANSPPAVYEQGRAVLRSAKSHKVAVTLLTPDFSSRTIGLPGFLLVVLNGGETPLGFSLANVRAYSGDREVRLFTPRELAWLIRQESSRQAEAAGGNAAADFVEQHTAPVAQSHTYDIRSIQEGRYEPDSPKPVVAEAVADIARNRQAEVTAVMTKAAEEPLLFDLQNLLREQVIAPGERAAGVVKLHADDIRAGAPLKLVIAVGAERHEFLFDAGTR